MSLKGNTKLSERNSILFTVHQNSNQDFSWFTPGAQKIADLYHYIPLKKGISNLSHEEEQTIDITKVRKDEHEDFKVYMKLHTSMKHFVGNITS